MIKMVEDLAAPGAVALVNIITKEAKPEWNEWAHYILTGLGYGAAFMGFGGAFVKNLGVASLSGTVDHIYTRVKGAPVTRRPTATASRLAFRVAPAVSREYQPEFEQAGAHAI